MEQNLNFLIENGTKWIVEQRDRHRTSAVELAAPCKDALKPYFRPETLEAVRVKEVFQIENPGFYNELQQAGQGIPLDFSRMAGITFVDTVLFSQLMSQPAPGSSNWVEHSVRLLWICLTNRVNR